MRSQNDDEDFYMALNHDYTVTFEVQKAGESEVTVAARGTWRADGDGVIVELTELRGNPVTTPDVLKFELVDGFPVATEYQAGDTLHNLEAAKFSIGAGERHPLVNELHKRMASIDYLNFTDPGDDLYTEETRKAVVAFQQAQGLLPDGVVNAATWVLLGNPSPPLPAPTPMPLPTTAPPVEGEPPPTGAPDLSKLATHTDDGSPIVYLTFDDGPSSFTTQMNDLFARYDAEVTYFALGQSVRSYPDIVRASASAGHYVANHTYSHESLESMTPEQFMNEVESTKQAILEVAGDLFTLDKDVKYLRPPYGATDANTRNYAAALGYAVVMWDIDPQDWRRPGADVIASHIISSVYPGAIVLSHDGGGDRTQTLAAYETAMRELSAQGYVFKNVFVGP